jgi:hypothetical protein
VVDPSAGLNGWEPVRQWLAGLAEGHVTRLIARQIAVALEGSLGEVRRDVQAGQAEIAAAMEAIGQELEAVSGAGEQQLMDKQRRTAKKALQRSFSRADDAIEAIGTETLCNVLGWLESESSLTDEDVVGRKLRKKLKKASDKQRKAVEGAIEEANDALCRVTDGIDGFFAERWRRLKAHLPTASDPREPRRATAAVAGRSVNVELGELPSATGTVMGGAAIGAGIGTFVPIVGTVVGGLVGGFLGWLFSDAEAEARQQIYSLASVKLSEMTGAYRELLGVCRQKSDAELSQVLDARVSAYRTHLMRARERIEYERDGLRQRQSAISEVEAQVSNWAVVAQRISSLR